MQTAVTRRVTSLVTSLVSVGLAVSLAGCGDDRSPPAAQAPDVAPLASPVEVATPGAAETIAQVHELGLERLQLADTGPELLPISPDGAAQRDPRVVGPPAPFIAESARVIDRASPGRLLGSALDALSAGDVAALARLSRSPAARPALDQDDAADAERRFLAAPARSLWSRIGAAARAGRVEVVPDGPAAAVMRIHVGGALGTVEVRLTKEGDGWYLAT